MMAKQSNLHKLVSYIFIIPSATYKIDKIIMSSGTGSYFLRTSTRFLTVILGCPYNLNALYENPFSLIFLIRVLWIKDSKWS